MAYLRYNFRSTVLRLYTSITVIYPANTHLVPVRYVPGMKYQTLYLLHGGSEDDTFWLRRTNIEEYAELAQLMVVCPATHNSLCVDTAYGARYFTYLTEELPMLVNTFFAASGRRKDTFVGGQGAGASGALTLAIRRPDLYACCVSMTPGMGDSLSLDLIKQRMAEGALDGQYAAIFGDPQRLEGSQYDLMHFAAEKAQSGEPLSRFFISVATGDRANSHVKVERDRLVALGYDVTFDEPEGAGHEYAYCDRQVKKAILEWLPLRRSPIYPSEGESRG